MHYLQTVMLARITEPFVGVRAGARAPQLLNYLEALHCMQPLCPAGRPHGVDLAAGQGIAGIEEQWLDVPDLLSFCHLEGAEESPCHSDILDLIPDLTS